MTIVGSHLISESATALCVKIGCSASCDGLSPRQERRSNINPPPFWKFIRNFSLSLPILQAPSLPVSLSLSLPV